MNKEIKLIVDFSLEGKKVRSLLFDHLKLSSRIVTKIKKNNSLFINGEVARADWVLHEGDVVTIYIEDGVSENIETEDIMPDILYEDEDVIVINKPRNMPTHPDKNHPDGTLANALMGYFNGRFTFRGITRLDKDTSGAVLVAKNPLAAQKLSEDMRCGRIYKEYIAIVKGVPFPLKGVITAFVEKGEKGIKRIISQNGKYAETHYKVERVMGELSYVSLVPITGRTHQLRLHMSHMGTPIVGDWLYGEAEEGEKTLLHCKRIRFAHPQTGRNIEVEAPAPVDFCKRCGTIEIG